MTIDNVSAGELIDPAWGNAVADRLNDTLPPIVQHGVDADTTSSVGQLTVTFPTAFANTDYTVVATMVETNSQVQCTAQVQARTTTNATFRILIDGVRSDNNAHTVHWVAIGTPA